MDFKLVSDYVPTGDQPEAIDRISQSIEEGNKYQTLVGVTGSGKTFAMANIIQRVKSLPWFLPTTRPWRPNSIVSSRNFSLKMLLNTLFHTMTTTNLKPMWPTAIPT